MNNAAMKMDQGGHMLPSNSEAEMSLLSACLIIPEALPVVIDILTPDDFYVPSHSLIFKSVSHLFAKNQPVDLITVYNDLESSDDLKDVRGMGELSKYQGASYLSFLTDSVPLAPNIQAYAEIVRDKAILRRLVAAGNSIVQDAWRGVGDPKEIVDRAEKAVFAVAGAEKRKSAVMLKYLLDAQIERMEMIQEKQIRISGMPTGFSDLDRLTSGLQDSDLFILAARPSMGKTALALNISWHVAAQGYPVGFFSMEMSDEQVCNRFISMSGGVDAYRMKNGFLGEGDWISITSAAGKLETYPIYIDDSAALTPLEVRARARRLSADHGVKLIVVDYLQLMRGAVYTEKREREVSEISASLKALAKELNVPVLALSQLNRKVEDRADRRPKMSDLRDSGSIEQDADVVAFIYRDEVYNRDENNPNRGKAEILIEKHRNGPTGMVSMYFNAGCMRFEDLGVYR